ncbi:MAG: hypothetical protein WCW27_02585 [Patescibacteria group bacterium]|jgi:hypothetical protein
MIELSNYFCYAVLTMTKPEQATLQRVLNVVLDVQDQQRLTNQRLAHLEQQQTTTTNRLDEFLTLANRHEAEIASLRFLYQRANN